MCASRGSGVVWRDSVSRGSGVVWRVSVSGSPRWSGGRLGRVRRGRPPSRPRGAVGSGAAAVESAADSVVSRDWGSFQYKKREFSIQDIIIYHYIS